MSFDVSQIALIFNMLGLIGTSLSMTLSLRMRWILTLFNVLAIMMSITSLDGKIF